MPLMTRLRYPLLFTGTVLLTGCISDDNDSGPEPTGLKADPDKYSAQQAPLRALSDLEVIRKDYEVMGQTDTLVLKLMDRLDDAWAGEGIGFNTDECAKANDNLTISYESSDTRDYARYVLKDCVVPGYGEAVRLDGSIAIEFTVGADSNTTITEETYDLEGSWSGRTLEIVGRRSTEVLTQSENHTETRVNITALEYVVGYRYMAIRDSIAILVENGEQVTKTSSGGFVSSGLDGYVDVSTPVTVAYDSPGECPNRGHLKFAGIGKLDVRYGENSAKGTGVERLLDGSEVEYDDTCNMDVPGVGTQPGGDS